jgi:hypothetical protein
MTKWSSNIRMEREKGRQLGMSMSLASGRLMRMILFDLVQRLNLDQCFHCSLKITTLVEFSIEHKKPWLHISPDLYWDLGNISFSHRKCNSGARRSRPRKWKEKKYKAAAFASWYAIPENRESWNKKRRERYKLRKEKLK